MFMTNMGHNLPESSGQEIDTASLLAHVETKLKEHSEDNKLFLKSTIIDVLGDVFGPDESTYVVKNRVPLLCQSVVSIREDIQELKTMVKDSHGKFVNQDQFFPVRSIVFGIAGILGVASMGAVLKLIFVQ